MPKYTVRETYTKADVWYDVEANSEDEATKKHNEGYCDYVEVDALDEHEILDEGTIESETK